MMRETTESSGRILVAAASFAALFSVVGLALYGLPFYYDHMVREFGWSRTQVTSGNAISKLIIGPLFGFFAGWIVDRFGPKRLMVTGIMMAGVALIGLGSMSALWMFYFFYIFNAVGYVCGGPLPNQVLLSQWFKQGRGKAMGFAYLGIGIGGAAVPLLSSKLTEMFGWRTALESLGVLIILVSLPLVALVREKNVKGDGPTSTVAPIGEIFRRPEFYLLALGSMCSIGAVGGANQHLKLFLSFDHHYADAEAARILSLVLTFSIAGRLAMGWLADRIPKKHVMMLVYLLVCSGIPLLFFASSRETMLLFAAVFGIGLGGEYLIIPLIAGELFGLRVLGRVMGLILTADGVAEAAFPMLIGYLRDQTGTYRTGFLLLIVLALAGALAVAFLPRKAASSTRSPESSGDQHGEQLHADDERDAGRPASDVP